MTNDERLKAYQICRYNGHDLSEIEYLTNPPMRDCRRCGTSVKVVNGQTIEVNPPKDADQFRTGQSLWAGYRGKVAFIRCEAELLNNGPPMKKAEILGHLAVLSKAVDEAQRLILDHFVDACLTVED